MKLHGSSESSPRWHFRHEAILIFLQAIAMAVEAQYAGFAWGHLAGKVGSLYNYIYIIYNMYLKKKGKT
jgi:hypothetical protein